MDLKEVLRRVPGLNRRFIYYLEAQGYISPAKVRKQRISRRDYGESDLAMAGRMWRYYQRGYSLQAAHELATRTERTVAYVAMSAPRSAWPVILERLREHEEVQEVSAVYASEVDIILRAEAPQDEDVYRILAPLFAAARITGAPRVYRTEERFLRDDGTATGEKGMLAYVLLTVPGKDVGGTLEKLKEFPEVMEASTVYGESDLILRVQVPDQETLDDLVMERIHGIPGVESTRTFIAIGKMHWSR